MAGSDDEVLTPLMREAAEVLRRVMPTSWSIDLKVMGFQGDAQLPWLEIKPSGGGTVSGFLIEAHETMTPRQVTATFGSNFARSIRSANGRPMLVMAERLTPQTRKMLEVEDVSYIDLSGNVRLDDGSVFVRFSEPRAFRTSSAKTGSGPTLRGAKVGQVVRVLVDAREPVSGIELARAAGVTEGYVSQILDLLEGEGLIDREPRGPVTEVDWPNLLRARAATLTLVAKHTTSYWVSPRGVPAMWDMLGEVAAVSDDVPRWALTGSLVAHEVAPIAAPSLAIVRVDRPEVLADRLGLLRSEGVGDVALVRLEQWGALERTQLRRGTPCVGWSQLVLDCLSGPGRMPAEGEAVLEWMAGDEQRWRLPSAALIEPPALR